MNRPLSTRLSALPIRFKLTLISAVTAFLAFALLGIVVFALLSSSAEQTRKRQIDLITPLFAAALVGPMIEHDYAAVREIAAQLVESEALEGLRILSSAGAIVAEAGNHPAAALPRSFVLRAAGLDFGTVEIFPGQDPFGGLRERLAWSLLAAAFLSSLLSLALFTLWTRRLGGRLARLADVAHQVAAGQLDARVDDASGDEIGQLAQDFNRMVETLQTVVQDLAAAQGEVTAILQSIGDGLIATDTTMRVTYLNPIAEALTGWSDAEARGRGVVEVFNIVNALTGQPAEIPVGRVLETGLVVGLANHTMLISRDGRRYHIADSAAPIRDHAGKLLGVVMVFRDISESYRLRADLETQRTRLALALKGANLGLWDRDLMSDALIVDERWAGMLGYRVDDFAAVKDPWVALIHPDDLPVAKRAFKDHLEGRSPQYEAEFRMRAKDGQWRWILSRGRITERDAEGRPLRVTGTHLDITERRAAQEEIERLAFYDPLTQLPNRRLLLDRIERELAEARRQNRYGALLFLDLDHFKQINDAHGHTAGDTLLLAVAAGLKSQLREVDTIARLGGDEFVVLLPGLAADATAAAAAARHVADKLRGALSQPFDLGAVGGVCHTAVSIGVTLFPDGTVANGEALMRQADTAMYQAKAGGRNTVCFFEPRMQAAVEERLAFENDLRVAIAERRFELYLQGQHDAAGRLVGAEVLLRWPHPERGMVPPSAFIPLAEESGLIDELGAWVLRKAALLAREIEEAGHDLRLSVNISPRQFRHADFVDRVRAILAETGASPARLVLEITESLLVSDAGEVTARMLELQALGLRFSIDDFGTGYSSLSYLKRLPLQELKIDRAFVAGLPQDADDAALVKTILLIAQQMHLETIAEGVETEAQFATLKQYGCSCFQGYLFGRPQPVTAFLARLGMPGA